MGSIPPEKLKREGLKILFDPELKDRIIWHDPAIPGVRDVGLTNRVPLSGDRHEMAIDVEAGASETEHAVARVDGGLRRTRQPGDGRGVRGGGELEGPGVPGDGEVDVDVGDRLAGAVPGVGGVSIARGRGSGPPFRQSLT